MSKLESFRQNNSVDKTLLKLPGHGNKILCTNGELGSNDSVTNWMCIKTSGCTKGYIYRVYVLLRWPEHVDRNQSLGNSKRADSEFIYCRIKVKRLFDCNNNQRLVE